MVLLRSLWTRQIVTQDEVKEMIAAMAQIEHLTLSEFQRTFLFAPHRPHRRNRNS